MLIIELKCPVNVTVQRTKLAKYLNYRVVTQEYIIIFAHTFQ